LYRSVVRDRAKPVKFRGSALDDLRDFPRGARREAGHQIDQVQQGREPDDWKPMNTVGQGVLEIRIREEEGAVRMIYVVTF
jgi:phage-related protein